MTARFSPDFLDLLIALNDAEAKYLLIGGHAVGFHGRPRATKDFDLWVEASSENAERVLTALRAFGAPLGDLAVSDLTGPGTGFRMGTPPFRIEILTEISGGSFEEAWTRKEELNVEGVRCRVIGREDLLRNKRAAGRPQDLADVEALERASPRRKG